MPDWDAAHYHRVSDPQTSWGLKVLERLEPRNGERILDIGCGTGRLTLALKDGVPDSQVAGIDRSAAMVAEARKTLPASVAVVHGDGAQLPFLESFDAVFSTATFHWIKDHPRLFAEIHRVLRPGGRLVAQAGGGPNLARLYQRCTTLAESPAYAPDFLGWDDPYYFAGVGETEARLLAAGLVDPNVWLESTPTSFADAASYRAFVTTVCLRHQLARLDGAKRDQYLDQLVEGAGEDVPAFTLDYWRLNIDARKR